MTTTNPQPIPIFCDRGRTIRQNLPRDLNIGCHVDHTLPPGTIEVWQEGRCLGRIENIGGHMPPDQLTHEEIIQARDTKIAMLQGALRAMTETAKENERIKVEDHATIRDLRARVAELEALHRTYYNQPFAEACQRAAIAERERCIKRLLELVPMADPDLTTEYMREELSK